MAEAGFVQNARHPESSNDEGWGALETERFGLIVAPLQSGIYGSRMGHKIGNIGPVRTVAPVSGELS